MKTPALTLALAILSTTALGAITVNQQTTYQTMLGFGAFGSGKTGGFSGGTPSQVAPADFIDSAVTNMGLSICRMEISPDLSPAAGEFVPSAMSLMQRYFYRKLRDKGVRTFIASVWSPPCYMKLNRLCVPEGGEDFCGSKPANVNNTLDPAFYNQFADFIIKFVGMFKDSIGVDLYALSLQNESAFDEPYNSCHYCNDQYTNMFKVVAPRIHQQYPNLKLFGAEDMGTMSRIAMYSDGLLKNDAICRANLDVYAVHAYTDGVAADYGSADGWTGIFNTVDAYNKPLWMTETSGYDDTWAGGFKLAKSIFLALKFGRISAWVWWSLCDNNGGNFSLIAGGNTFTMTPKAYCSKNYYRFIRPGAKMVECNTGNTQILGVAFTHSTDNTVTIVLINNGTTQLSTSVTLSGTIQPASFNIWRTSATSNCVFQGNQPISSAITLPANSVTTLYSALPTAVVPAAPLMLQKAVYQRQDGVSRFYLPSGRLAPSRNAGSLPAGCYLVKTPSTGHIRMLVR